MLLLRRHAKPGFVLVDMTDVDDFAPIEDVAMRVGTYVVIDPQRGDDMRN